MSTIERIRGINPVEDAKEAWAKMDKNQRMRVRVGMTDVAILREFNYMPKDSYKEPNPALSTQFTLALMTEASKDGGMIA